MIAPNGVAVRPRPDGGDSVYVADIFRLFEFDRGLMGPTGLALYPPDGSLLVVEANAGRLSKTDPATGNVTVLTEGLQVGSRNPNLLSLWV